MSWSFIGDEDVKVFLIIKETCNNNSFAEFLSAFGFNFQLNSEASVESTYTTLDRDMIVSLVDSTLCFVVGNELKVSIFLPAKVER